MKVIYFITASEFGRGGHYYSLLKTANEIGEHEEVTIISIGIKRSPVLEQSRVKYIHIDYTSIFKTLVNVLRVIENENANILHAFDSQAFFYANCASIFNKIPLVLTRCGGENPKYYPYNKELIVYTIENHDFFRKNIRFKNTNLSLIANRVEREVQDYKKINKIKKYLKPSVPTVLRIARISNAYKKSILQSIYLIKILNERNIAAQLVIVGYIQDQQVFNELVKHASDKVYFFTETEFTINASSLIDVADFVVGTGRGFMEAALLGKIMLVPTANTNIPILVRQDKVLEIFRVNFSPRYQEIRSEDVIIAEVIDAFDLIDAEEKSGNLIDFAKENFSIDGIYRKHLPIYKRAKPAEFKLHELVLQVALIIKPLYRLRKLFFWKVVN